MKPRRKKKEFKNRKHGTKKSMKDHLKQLDLLTSAKFVQKEKSAPKTKLRAKSKTNSETKQRSGRIVLFNTNDDDLKIDENKL